MNAPFAKFGPCCLLAAVLALHPGLLPSSHADTVTDWNAELISAIRDTALNPPKASRQMAILHLAIYDAVNGIDRTHTPYHLSDLAPAGASMTAAVSAAGKTVMDALYAGEDHASNATVRARALARYTADLASVPDGASENDGVAWGVQAANALLALRASDHSTDVVAYTAAPAPGIWRPTPPANAPPLLPNWPLVTPFGLVSGDQVRPQRPPALTGAAYALELNLTRDIGGAASLTRTPEQNEIALFWADGGGTETPPGHWMHIARDVSAAQGLSLQENARLFALLGMAQADAAIVAWDSKYAFNYWRPITAIREADTDENSATSADASWSPFLGTPPFPEYTSGHSTFSRASATVLARFFGTDEISFSIPSDGMPAVLRSYPGFSAAADESGISRIFGGIHFQSGNIAGQTSGHLLGEFVWKHYLQPIGELEFTLIHLSATAADLQFSVLPGRSYRLEASSDLNSWEQLATISSATTIAHYTDVNPPAGKRFYKAVLLP